MTFFEGFEKLAREGKLTAEKAFEATKARDIAGLRRFEGQEALGLETGKIYEPEETESWFNKLREYSAFEFNFPGSLGPNWVRGAQLGLSPEAYSRLAQETKDKVTTRMQEMTRGFTTEGIAPENLFQLQSKLRTAAEKEALSPVEKYLFGLTDVSPVGMSIPAGPQPTMLPGGGKPMKTEAEEWFQEKFPSIAGERGGVRRTGFGWRDVLAGQGRFAPKIKTISF